MVGPASSLSFNAAPDGVGGALAANGCATVLLSDATFANNTANSAGAVFVGGGGKEAAAGSGSSGGKGGAAVPTAEAATAAVVLSCTFRGNSANGTSGGNGNVGLHMASFRCVCNDGST